ncbi:cytochrome P450 [Larkinella rosea]|uniref:Cytochrome P450 n=1 Tax=Larkinella rosea TaxID=2025312 RepID=A0A3P1BEU8_9BACT|nr:cytochrome P450 [Larkinella rosea]RRA99193.1 cytochrome P450 [Larkinella rosea]
MVTDEKPTKPIPKLKGLPFLGSTLDFARDPLAFLTGLQQKYDRLVQFDAVGRLITLTLTPEDARYILQENNKNYVKSAAYDVLKMFLGNGLLNSEGDFWRRQRRLAQPAFHKQRLALLVDGMNRETAGLMASWKNRDLSKPLLISEEMMQLALAIVTRSLFSSDVKNHLENVSEAITTIIQTAYKEIFNFFPATRNWPTPRTIRYRRAVRKTEAIIYEIIENRRREPPETRHDDLLGMLMETRDDETGEQMTNQQLRDEVTTIFMAGHETTANALSWAFYLLANHPDVTEKLREEINMVLGPTDLPTMETLRELTYATQVIQETMRLYPPAWIFGRQPLHSDQFGDYRVEVPKADGMLICPYLLHRDPRYWEKPETFEPEHFLPERVKNRPTYAYLPFGGGPRLCIGNNFAMMEMQIVLTLLIREFDFLPADSKKVEAEPGITLRPKGGLRLRVRARHKAGSPVS